MPGAPDTEQWVDPTPSTAPGGRRMRSFGPDTEEWVDNGPMSPKPSFDNTRNHKQSSVGSRRAYDMTEILLPFAHDEEASDWSRPPSGSSYCDSDGGQWWRSGEHFEMLSAASEQRSSASSSRPHPHLDQQAHIEQQASAFIEQRTGTFHPPHRRKPNTRPPRSSHGDRHKHTSILWNQRNLDQRRVPARPKRRSLQCPQFDFNKAIREPTVVQRRMRQVNPGSLPATVISFPGCPLTGLCSLGCVLVQAVKPRWWPINALEYLRREFHRLIHAPPRSFPKLCAPSPLPAAVPAPPLRLRYIQMLTKQESCRKAALVRSRDSAELTATVPEYDRDLQLVLHGSREFRCNQRPPRPTRRQPGTTPPAAPPCVAARMWRADVLVLALRTVQNAAACVVQRVARGLLGRHTAARRRAAITEEAASALEAALPMEDMEERKDETEMLNHELLQEDYSSTTGRPKTLRLKVG